MTFCRVDQPTALKRPIGDERDTALGGQRQDALLDLAIADVVGGLHEIDRPGAHDRLHLGMPPAMRCGDTDVAHGALALHLEQGFQVRLPGEQVVHLDQVEPLDTPQTARRLDLGGPVFTRRGPDLGRREQARRPAQPTQAVTDHRLGRAIHRRRIKHAATKPEKRTQQLGALRAGRRIVADVERDRTAHADRRDTFTAGRDRLDQHGLPGIGTCGATDQGTDAHGEQRNQPPSVHLLCPHHAVNAVGASSERKAGGAGKTLRFAAVTSPCPSAQHGSPSRYPCPRRTPC